MPDQINPETVSHQPIESIAHIEESPRDIQLKAEITELIIQRLTESGELDGKTPEQIAKLTGQIAAGGAIGVLKVKGHLPPKPDSEKQAEDSMGDLLTSFMNNGAEVHDDARGEYITTIDRKALFDKDTGALNQKGLEKRLKDADSLPPQAVLFTDVKNFKAINDLFGHARGDEVIKDVYGILSSSLRDDDVIARLHGEAGDEFIAVLTDDSEGRDRNPEEGISPEEVINVAKERIKEEIRKYLENKKNKDLVGVGFDISVGGVEWEEGTTIKELIAKAEAMMKIHKEEQRHATGRYNRSTKTLETRTAAA